MADVATRNIPIGRDPGMSLKLHELDPLYI